MISILHIIVVKTLLILSDLKIVNWILQILD